MATIGLAPAHAQEEEEGWCVGVRPAWEAEPGHDAVCGGSDPEAGEVAAHFLLVCREGLSAHLSNPTNTCYPQLYQCFRA